MKEGDFRPEQGRLVLGVKTSETSSALIAWVAAQTGGRQRPIVVLHAWAGGRPGDPEVGRVDWFDVKTWPVVVEEPANSVVDLLCTQGMAALACIRCAEPGLALLDELDGNDEVVIGNNPHSGWRHALGDNVVHHLIAAAPCPVVVVPRDWRPADPGRRRVVAGWDGTADCERVLTWAVHHCARIAADLDIARVGPGEQSPSATRESDADLITRIQRSAAELGDIGVRLIDATNLPGGTAVALDTLAATADALVIGAHPTTWLAEFVQWDTADRAIAAAQCPVVIVPLTGLRR